MDLAYIHFFAGYKYQLSREYKMSIPITGMEVEAKYFSLFADGSLVIRAGYCWDGASCAIDTKTIMRASLIHDALYQMLRLGHLPRTYRQRADEILKTICLEDGMWKGRAWWVFKAVRRFGASAAHPDHRRIEITSP